MKALFEQTLSNMKKQTPLVYCLSNAVTIADCANILCAVGASPLMSFGREDIREILSASQAILLNIGDMDDAHMSLIPDILNQAKTHRIPVVLDPVGVGFTSSRMRLAKEILKYPVACIRGNRSEIEALVYDHSTPTSRGIDALPTRSPLPKADISKFAKALNCIVVVTGPKDFVTDGTHAVSIDHGHPSMSRIVGTGCMSGAMVAAMIGVGNPFWGSIVAMTLIGLAGEKAFQNPHTPVASAKIGLMDAVEQLCSGTSFPPLRIDYEKS